MELKNKILIILEKRPLSKQRLINNLHANDNQNQINEINQILKELINKKIINYSSIDNTYFSFKNTIIGKFISTKKGFGLIESSEPNKATYFIPPSFTYNAFEGDIVLIKQLMDWKTHVKNGLKECKIVQVLERSKSIFIGTVRKEKDKKIVKLNQSFLDYQLYFMNVDKYQIGDVVGLLINKIERNNVYFEIQKNFGNESESITDLNLVLGKFNYPITFSDKVLDLANKLKPNFEIEAKDRKNFENELIVTIDGDDAKDLDDAINVKKTDKGYQIGVHIADVSFYAKEDSIIDQEAFERGTSVYLINKVIPMLPEKLSNDLCSLNPNTKKLTLSCISEIDEKGNLLSYQIFPSIINSKYRLTYSFVNKVLKDEPLDQKVDPKLIEFLKLANKVAQILRKRKESQGMINFDLEETKVEVDQNWKAQKLFFKKQDLAEALIEDFMVLANESVATFFIENKVHGLYRIHDKPPIENVIELLNYLNFFNIKIDKLPEQVNSFDFQKLLEKLDDSDFTTKIIKKHLIRSMAKAEYSSKNIGHFGLGLKNYTHFTSPIRRYSDLIVHRIIRNVLFEHKKTFLPSKTFVDLTNQMNETERNAMSAERLIVDIKKAEYMEQFISKTFLGYVVTVKKFGIFVELENSVEGLIPIEFLEEKGYKFIERGFGFKNNANQTIKLGDKVKVLLVGIQKISGSVILNYENNSTKSES